MTPFRENLRGIGLIVACNAFFIFNDSLIKLTSATLPLGEIILLRGVFVTILLAPIVLVTGTHREVSLLRNWALVGRTAGEILAAFLYLAALFHIPIANANTVTQVVPLMVTAAGALFLGEAVGWRRWTAIFVGFAGVLIVVRPGLAGFNGYSLLALASAVAVTLRDIGTRLMPRALSASLVALITGIAVGACGPLYALVIGETWVAPPLEAIALLAAAVVFLVGGYLTSVAFMRHGDISVVAPFRYVAILWAIVVGFVLWREVPDWPMLAGMAVIAASGIYTFRRERNLARLAAEAASGEGL